MTSFCCCFSLNSGFTKYKDCSESCFLGRQKRHSLINNSALCLLNENWGIILFGSLNIFQGSNKISIIKIRHLNTHYLFSQVIF